MNSLQVIPQQHEFDCSVACLAMLLGMPYEEVLAAFRHNVCAHGATVRQVLRVAKQLGKPLTWSRRTPDWENTTGILGVASLKWTTDHLVILREGVIIDTDGSLWDVDVYLAAYEARAVSVMTIEEETEGQ